MAQATKGSLNFRCPSCFMRDIDIDMFFDEQKKEYYCLRCGFTGSEEDVLRRVRAPQDRWTRQYRGSLFPSLVRRKGDGLVVLTEIDHA